MGSGWRDELGVPALTDLLFTTTNPIVRPFSCCSHGYAIGFNL